MPSIARVQHKRPPTPVLLALLGAIATHPGCGPGLEEGLPDGQSVDARAPDGPAAADGGDAGAPADLAGDAWRCVEYSASTYDHVQAGRAYLCGGDACAYGSDQRLGLYNIANIVVLRQTARDHFERGRCP